MKKNFYNNLTEEIISNKEVYITTITKAKNEELVGKKILRCNDELIFEQEVNIEFYKNIINSIDFNSYGKILVLDEDTEVFVEQIIPKPQLVICGGGHVALDLCSVGKMLDFNVIVIDDRKEFANESRFNIADKVICKSFEEALSEVNGNNSYFVIVTRGHRDDRKCLEIILNKNHKYVGMIGSKGKVAMVRSKLIQAGYTKEELNKVHTPIGLNIGAETPAEIAISIAAEIISIKNEGDKPSYIDYNILNTIKDDSRNKVLVSILNKKGSSPRGVGAKMLVFEDGDFMGTIGGGSVENAAYEKALDLIKKQKSCVEIYDLSNSKAATLGMACGGKITVLFEYIN